MTDLHVSDNKPLRLRYPAVYQDLIEKLNKVGLQPYDVIADITDLECQEQVLVRIRFGRMYQRSMEQAFYEERMHEIGNEILDFLDQVVRACQQTNVAEYREFIQQS